MSQNLPPSPDSPDSSYQPKPDSRVTQQDVAEAVGVSRSAVSMAFKNHPRISEKMRVSIRETAARMGYAPDPMLMSLAAYRNRQRPASFHGTLAWLVNSTGGFRWNRISQFAGFYEGARTVALRHGFQLEVFDLAASEAGRAGRVASMLRARNVTGVLVAPQPEADTRLTDFPWEDFAAVALGYTLAAPRLHVVAAAQFRAAIECLRRLRETGHKRIGFLLSREHVERTQLQYLGAWMASQEMDGLGGQVPAALMDKAHPPGPFREWMQRYKPDGIISGEYLPGQLRRLGWRVPEDVSVACPNLPDDKRGVSGVWEVPRGSGAAADLLVSLIHRGERGIPDTPQTVLVEGRWMEGDTLRAR
jgi:DNA-binding LacI/PurR family transcriptional regulator